MIKLHATTDPGHGWLKVPMELINRLKLGTKISIYSYRAAGYAFLEEDHDWVIFDKAMEKEGLEFKIKHSHTDKSSVIREYPQFFADPDPENLH